MARHSCYNGIICRTSVVDKPFYTTQRNIETARKLSSACNATFFTWVWCSNRALRPIIPKVWTVWCIRFAAAKVQFSDISKPIAPSNEPAMYEDGLIIPMISKTFEEDSASQERYLQGLDIYVHTVFVPRPKSNSIGDESRKDSVEIE